MSEKFQDVPADQREWYIKLEKTRPIAVALLAEMPDEVKSSFVKVSSHAELRRVFDSYWNTRAEPYVISELEKAGIPVLKDIPGTEDAYVKDGRSFLQGQKERIWGAVRSFAPKEYQFSEEEIEQMLEDYKNLQRHSAGRS